MTWRQILLRAIRPWQPAPVRVTRRERGRAAIGAGLGIALAALTTHWLTPGSGLGPWLVAPMGATAVLVFAVPASPLAQPWAVIGGNGLSALVGIACAAGIADPTLAAALAVSGAIATMFALRCLHPPGGASALLMVLGHTTSPWFALSPVLANSVLMVVAGVAYNHLTGHRYPHAQQPPPRAQSRRSRFERVDFDAALAHMDQVLDIPRDQLERLLDDAELSLWRRTLGAQRCADVMSTDVVSAEFGTRLDDAWRTMRARRIKALPVIDRARRVVGIATMADFLGVGRSWDEPAFGLGDRLLDHLRPSGRVHSERPEVVGQVMNTTVQTARADDRVVDLIPLFSRAGHHHLPIVDHERRLVGILTQTDLVRVMTAALQRPDA